MGNEPTYLGVLGGLGRSVSALNANTADLAHLDGARLRLAKIETDDEGPFRSRTPKTSTPSEPTALAPTLAPPTALLATDANSKQ